MINWTLEKFKTFAPQKTPLRRWKIVVKDQEKFCNTYIWERTYVQNNTMQLNWMIIQLKNNVSKRFGHFTKKTYVWLISIQKGVQHL